MSDLLMKELNQYTPHNYTTMTEGERNAAREGFKAGYNYRESLTPAQAVTDEMVERAAASLFFMVGEDDKLDLTAENVRRALVAALTDG
jgi:hypothetical protein